MAGNLLQFQSHWILARLRRQLSCQGKKEGDYSIPRGGAFELVSCPHYLGEIVIYGGLMIMLGRHNSLTFLIFSWVVSPFQACHIEMSHALKGSAVIMRRCCMTSHCAYCHLILPLGSKVLCNFTGSTLVHFRWQTCCWRLDPHTSGTRGILSNTQRVEEPSFPSCID